MRPAKKKRTVAPVVTRRSPPSPAVRSSRPARRPAAARLSAVGTSDSGGAGFVVAIEVLLLLLGLGLALAGELIDRRRGLLTALAGVFLGVAFILVLAGL